MKLLKIKPAKWKVYIFLILLGILLVALWKGCANNKPSKDQLIIDSLNNRIKYIDSIANVNKIDYVNSNELANGLIEIANNRVTAVEHENDSLNKRIDVLLKKHKPILPSTDTSITTVSNEFINECSECFTLLDHSQQGNLKLRAEKDNLVAGYKSKMNLQDNRINQLGVENANLRKTLTSAISTAQTIEDKSKPRRKLFFSLGAISGHDWYVFGAGGGLLYMDKRERIYGANGFGTNRGPLFTGSVSFPLSLRKKK